jgi:hypothetical protein
LPALVDGARAGFSFAQRVNRQTNVPSRFQLQPKTKDLLHKQQTILKQ